MSFMKRTVAPVVSALTLIFAMGVARADGPQNIAPAGPSAQQTSIPCFAKKDLEEGLKESFNMSARERGDHPQFELQIYANDEGRWLLAGEPKDKSFVEGATPDMELSCALAQDTGGYPDQVQASPWYKQFFGPPAPRTNV